MDGFHYRHIIWDWNGTLFDDAWLCVRVMNGMLARRKLDPITPARYESIFDFPVMDYYRQLGFDFSTEPFERLSDEFIGGYLGGLRECRLREGALDALVAGWQRGLTQSILSAMKQQSLEELLDHFGVRHYFTDVVGLNDHHAFGKTEIGKAWIDAQELDRRLILFVGDTTHDYEVAQALGVDCVCIHSGHHSRERLAATGVRILDSLLELYG